MEGRRWKAVGARALAAGALAWGILAAGGSAAAQAASHYVAYGFGDGSAGDCWCYGNSEILQGEGCRNSTGVGAVLSGAGSTSVSADDMVLFGSQLVPGQSALLFAGTQDVDGLSFGDGLRFVGGTLVRLGTRTPDGTGRASWTGLSALGHWQGGDTRYFQIWYRDPSTSLCSYFFNLSSALQVHFDD